MKALTAAALLMISTPCFALDIEASTDLPFTYRVESVHDTDTPIGTLTVAVLNVENGEHFLGSVAFHCEAENLKGRTWDVTGMLTNVDINSQRKVRLTSSNPDTTGEFNDAVKLKCSVQRFEIPLM